LIIPQMVFVSTLPMSQVPQVRVGGPMSSYLNHALI